jgi:uncharacterized protein YggU (UPF0235/DUF167 family)
MLHPMEATITVRVTPRSGRSAVTIGPSGVLVRVRAAPEGGRATAEAGMVLAAALGVPKTAVRLRSGARSRVKVFAVAGLVQGEPERRLRAL